MTGSRGLIIFFILAILGYVCLEGFRDLSSLMNSLGKFLIPAVVGFVLVVSKFSAAITSFEARASKSDDILPRIFGAFTEPFVFFQHALFSGYGIGATFQANGVIRSVFSLPPGEHIPVYFEAETGRVALELGIIGFFAWYALKIVLLVALWNTYQQLRKPFLKQLAISIFLFQIINITSQYVFNHSANVYFWFLSGFILALPQIEQMETWQHNNFFRQTSDRSFQVNPHS